MGKESLEKKTLLELLNFKKNFDQKTEKLKDAKMRLKT